MTNLRLVLADQLTHSITSLSGIDRKNDVVIMSELIREFTYVKHHNPSWYATKLKVNKHKVYRGYRVHHQALQI